MSEKQADNKKKENISKGLDRFARELSEDEKDEILSKKDYIVTSLMSGKFSDLGGIVAMRGFVYQYYVAMFYAVAMLYKKNDSWWDSVILEYFDDVALVGENKIRFIQVKTVRENASNKHTAANFTTRKKLSRPESDRVKFNSWIEKVFLNYDYFLDDENILENGINRESYSPEFEITTNSASVTLQDIDLYTLNGAFNNVKDNSSKDKIRDKILKPVKNKLHEEIYFNDVAKKDLEFYLQRLYINKFGSIKELYSNIREMISEILAINDIREPSIIEYIIEKLFTNIIHRCYNDNEDTLKKSNLVIGKNELDELFKHWVIESKEVITATSFQDTAVGLFEKASENLKNEFIRYYTNEGLRTDLIETLGWFREVTNTEIKQSPSYCVHFLNKLFNTNNTLTLEDFKHTDSELHLRNSIKHIVYFLTFYSEKQSNYKDAKLIFHNGESNLISSVLFTIYHARNQYSNIESKNKVVTTLLECEVSNKQDNDIYCLVLGSKFEPSDKSSIQIASKFMATSISESEISIIEVPDKIHFVDIEKFEDFFKGFQQENIFIDSFQHEELLKEWDDHIKRIVIRE